MTQLLSEGLKSPKGHKARLEYEKRRERRKAKLRSEGRHLEAMLQHMNCSCSVSPDGRSVQINPTKPRKRRKKQTF